MSEEAREGQDLYFLEAMSQLWVPGASASHGVSQATSLGCIG